MRVLLVTHYYPDHRSGIERIAGELATRLPRHGIELTWAATATGEIPTGIRCLPVRGWNITEDYLGFPYPLWHPADLLRVARAARTADGLASAEARIAGSPVERLASGPGLVAAAFGIDTSWTGRDLCDPSSALRLERDVASDPSDVVADEDVAITARVGIDYAGPDWASRPWRFSIAGHPSVSGPRPR